jgi:hypothetical protein
MTIDLPYRWKVIVTDAGHRGFKGYCYDHTGQCVDEHYANNQQQLSYHGLALMRQWRDRNPQHAAFIELADGGYGDLDRPVVPND